MDWTTWGCLGALTVAAVALVVLPERVVEARTRAQLAHAVLVELLDADRAPRSTRELRRRLRLSRSTFYGLVERLLRRGLVEAVTVSGPLLVGRTLRLTDRGLRRALRRPPTR